MRKEIYSILLFFCVIFILFSLFSFSPLDLSDAGAPQGTHNLFGVAGAWISSILMGVFGIGSFWFPLILFYIGINLLSGEEIESRDWIPQASGAVLLIIATGGLFNRSSIFGERFQEGSIISGTIQDLLFRYAQPAGGYLIMLSVFLVGFILVSRMSIFRIILKLSYYTAISIKTFCMAFIGAAGSGIAGAKKYASEIQLWLRNRRNEVHEKNEDKAKTNPTKINRQEETSSPVTRAEQKPLSEKASIEPKAVNTETKSPKAQNEVLPQKRIQISEPLGSSQTDPENDITIKDERPKPSKIPHQIKLELELPFARKEGFQLPSISLLDTPQIELAAIDEDFLRSQSRVLEEKLGDFGVQGKVVTVLPGPVVTTFEYQPAPGVKISKVVNLADDLALALRALSIRIVAPIPGKGAIGIEIPNEKREMVSFKEMIVSGSFQKIKSKLAVCLGKDIVGNPVAVELDKMPHLLIAGATGAGKSVGLNVMITSLLYKATPDEVKLIMIDPKRIELSVYDGIPHLIAPVVTDMKKATNALYWAVREMEARYQLLADHKVRNISQFNKKVEKLWEEDPEQHEELEKLPYIVIIIDELADLMMVASKEVEVAIARLAQMARASGIHLVIATQRPSVDVLTGMIKANFPTRMSFQVSSKIDSRTIIDSNGAEQLLGNGDMLYLPPGTAKLQRIHGAYISEDEVLRVIEYLKEQQEPEYIDDVIQGGDNDAKAEVNTDDYDEKYDEAVAFVAKQKHASISMVQRHLRIGYNRAARIIEIMEREGVVGPSDGAKPREVLITSYDLPGGDEDAA